MKLTEEYIQGILDQSEFTFSTQFDKVAIVACKLPNGFIIVEHSAFIDPKDYDEEMGKDLCLQKIGSKLWELEGYKMHNEVKEQQPVDYIKDVYNDPQDAMQVAPIYFGNDVLDKILDDLENMQEEDYSIKSDETYFKQNNGPTKENK